MRHTHFKYLIIIALIACFSTVLAQTVTVTQYTPQDIVWQVDATIDYVATPAQGANLFMSVATGVDGTVYVAAYNNILIFDGETGAKIGTIVDETGTIQHYSDIEVVGDGTFWIADQRSSVYRVDADGTILSIVDFEVSPGFDVRPPGEIELDPEGNLWVNYGGYGIHFQVFTPEGDYIRSIISSAFALQGVNHFTFAPDGTLFFQGAGIGWLSEEGGQVTVHEFAPDFMAPDYLMFYGIAIDADGSVYFTAGSDGDLGVSVFQLDSDGSLIGQFGRGQERANWSAAFDADVFGYDAALALAPDGDLIIADYNSTYSKLTRLNTRNAP